MLRECVGGAQRARQSREIPLDPNVLRFGMAALDARRGFEAELAQLELLDREQPELARGVGRQESLRADGFEVAMKILRSAGAAPGVAVALDKLEPSLDAAGFEDRSDVFALELGVLIIGGPDPQPD